MIERYFQQGVRVKWDKNKDDTTGSMDGSTTLQAPATSRMIYDGMDAELLNSMFHANSLGLNKGSSINFDWLDYKPGHTAKIIHRRDTLTGWMSGCYICTWTEAGTRYVGHNGTVDAEGALNDRVRKNFRDNMPRDARGFSPASAWAPEEISVLGNRFKTIKEAKIVALVTTTGEFYSMVIFNMQNGQWCIGGIKLVPGYAYASLRFKLGATAFG